MTSLADLQRDPAGRPPEGPPGLPLAVQQVRTFDTPEFRGMRFVEVEAKSALNGVRGMPFSWSINPYRGCSHACSYCLSGETQILMADGRTKRLAALRVGDAVYGTERRGDYHRYVTTRVLDHWWTVKPAYLVQLEDGTRLIASADHRFLTDRGWKHVTGTQQGPVRRPHLTCGDKLMGSGGFAAPPKETPDYRRGYLCGMIRRDVDEEALERSRGYLAAEGIATQAGRIVAWPDEPSKDWSTGFLGGIFDAEGSCSRGILRITNTDPAILRQIVSCLRRFDYPFVIERSVRVNGSTTVRLVGGLPTHLRFFHAVDPAITRKRTIEGQAIRSNAPLGVMAVKPLGIDLPMFDITTGTGDFIADGVVSHNCFARPTHAYLNLSPGEDFERVVVVKTNVVEVLRRELARPSWRGEHVAMGTNTDPYQRAEGRYRLMPGIIDTLAASLTPFSILTKGTLITQDVKALRRAAQRVPVSAALTVGMLDARLWRSSEPGTPSPVARLAAVKTLNDAGIPTGVMLAPIMPALNDDAEQLAELVERAVLAGATQVTPIVLHLRPGVRELFWPWLERHHPELTDRYRALYTRAEAARSYRDEVVAFVRDRRERAWRSHGRPRRPHGLRGAPADRLRAPSDAEQLGLF